MSSTEREMYAIYSQLFRRWVTWRSVRHSVPSANIADRQSSPVCCLGCYTAGWLIFAAFSVSACLACKIFNYGGSSLSAKGKRRFCIYNSVDCKIAVWTTKPRQNRGFRRTHLFCVRIMVEHSALHPNSCRVVQTKSSYNL